MNIRKLKSLLWFAAFLALLGAGWTFWDILQGKKTENRYKARPLEYYHEVLQRDGNAEGVMFVAGPTSYAEKDYKKIWEARIDGSVEPVVEVKGPGSKDENAVVEVPLEPLDSVLKVGMVLWSPDPLNRLIAVEYMSDAGGVAGGGTATKQRRLHLTQGEPLREPYDEGRYMGKVLRIERQQVVFQWGGEGEEVVLTPGLDSSGTGLPIDQRTFAAQEDLSGEFPDWPEESLQRDDGSWVFGRNDMAYLQGDGAREVMEEQIQARTITPKDGGRSELELTKVEPGSMPARFGMQSGDRIISVNGHPMSSKAEAINWGKNNPNEPVYDVLYTRRGVEQHLIIHGEDL